jgi:cyclopropane-fatty-acyl-phospholipid synthase
VLEIGCGWGALAERLAQRHGAHVTGLTLSTEQLAHAKARGRRHGLGDAARPAAAGLSRRAGQYDRIVSIEMLEAVGEAYWPRTSTCCASGSPGGVRCCRSSPSASRGSLHYREGADFIQRFIFPGGMLPSIGVMREQIARAGLVLTRLETFGASYGRTLAEWAGRFQAAWPTLAAKGFDERFRRKWEYYLAYCEAGFRTGAIDVGLYRFEHAA